MSIGSDHLSRKMGFSSHFLTPKRFLFPSLICRRHSMSTEDMFHYSLNSYRKRLESAKTTLFIFGYLNTLRARFMLGYLESFSLLVSLRNSALRLYAIGPTKLKSFTHHSFIEKSFRRRCAVEGCRRRVKEDGVEMIITILFTNNNHSCLS